MHCNGGGFFFGRILRFDPIPNFKFDQIGRVELAQVLAEEGQQRVDALQPDPFGLIGDHQRLTNPWSTLSWVIAPNARSLTATHLVFEPTGQWSLSADPSEEAGNPIHKPHWAWVRGDKGENPYLGRSRFPAHSAQAVRSHVQNRPGHPRDRSAGHEQ